MLAVRRKLAGRRITVGEDKAYDTADHAAKLRAVDVTPHVTQNHARRDGSLYPALKGDRRGTVRSTSVSASLGQMVSGGRLLRPSSAWRPTRASSQARAQIASILRTSLRGFHVAWRLGTGRPPQRTGAASWPLHWTRHGFVTVSIVAQFRHCQPGAAGSRRWRAPRSQAGRALNGVTAPTRETRRLLELQQALGLRRCACGSRLAALQGSWARALAG